MQLYTSGSLTEGSAGMRSGSSESEWGSSGSSECVVGLVRWGCLHRHRLDSYVQYANRYEGNYLMKARPSPGCREKMEQMTHTFMQQWLQYVYCRRCSVSLLPASTYQWIIMRYGMLYRIVLYGREKECNWCSIYCAQCKVQSVLNWQMSSTFRHYR